MAAGEPVHWLNYVETIQTNVYDKIQVGY